MKCPSCNSSMIQNVRTKVWKCLCGYWCFSEEGHGPLTVVTGQRASYEEAVYQEHVKLAEKLRCNVNDIYVKGEGRGYSGRHPKYQRTAGR